MGQAGLVRLFSAALIGGGYLIAQGSCLAQSRFLSYDTEAECLAGHDIAAPLCHSAFANARTEFEARTPNFPTLLQCVKSFGDCAPWPPGSASKADFRPRWQGVDIVDTPKEKSVTPSLAADVKPLTFAPQPLTEFRNLDVRGAKKGPVTQVRLSAHPAIRRRPGAGEPYAPSGDAPPPKPGSGFKLEDGVLTYPAPARFQPKNLPALP